MRGSEKASPASLDDYEVAARLNELAGKQRFVVISTFATIFLCLAACFLYVRLFALYFFVATCIVAVLGLIYLRYNEEAKGLISDCITAGALKEVFDWVEYNHKGYVNPDDIRASELIPRWRDCKGSDLVAGEYRGLRLRFSDIELTHTEGGGKNKKTVTDFKGQWLVLELTKRLDAHLRVIERGQPSRLSTKSDIETENMEFNKKFQIKTDDPHTAFLILTPHFMEYINQMDFKARHAKTSLWFSNNCVHIALHNYLDLFEPGGIFKPENFFALRDRINDQISYITGIVDELMLNDYLFGRD